MNGDLGKIYNLLTEVKTRNETLWEQHDERSVIFKEDIKEEIRRDREEIKYIKIALNKISEAVTKSPCDVHEAELAGVKKAVVFSWVIFTFIIGGWTTWIMFYLRSLNQGG